jgi:hypothetical protein
MERKRIEKSGGNQGGNLMNRNIQGGGNNYNGNDDEMDTGVINVGGNHNGGGSYH